MPEKYQRTDAGRLSDLATIEYITPALRTLAAFLIYLRFGRGTSSVDIMQAYHAADVFTTRLKDDYQS